MHIWEVFMDIRQLCKIYLNTGTTEICHYSRLVRVAKCQNSNHTKLFKFPSTKTSSINHAEYYFFLEESFL
jgi:hypothetical protein